MHIALIQQRAGDDLAENLARGLAAFERAADEGAQLVCFAELAFEPFYPREVAGPEASLRAQSIPGMITEAFSERARARGVVVVLNLFERAGDQCFDASPVIDADGRLLGTTRMIHITDYPGFHEQGYYAPGDRDLPVYHTAVGKVGVAICYDRHFPEAMRALALGGADLVVIPQAGTEGEWPAGLYEAELQVAAFQNGYFTALCNRVGREGKLVFAGESFVCAPDGRVIARAGRGTEEILHADLDLHELDDSSALRLFLRHRRPDLYARWLRCPPEKP